MSRFLTSSALSSMNLRRASTSSPISVVKMASVSVRSSSFTSSRVRRSRRVLRADRVGERADAVAPVARATLQARDPLEIIDCGAHDVDARVGVLDPAHRYLADRERVALCEVKQLGVEEPTVVLDQRQQGTNNLASGGLEAALRVAESGAERH